MSTILRPIRIGSGTVIDPMWRALCPAQISGVDAA
jgi:hypothetical protein